MKPSSIVVAVAPVSKYATQLLNPPWSGARRNMPT